jgi:CheY-like chemotaxis protein
MMLSTVDLDLVFTENGREAVEAFGATAFDLVVLDMQLPFMDGLEAPRAIREIERLGGARRTPVVMLTAHALPEHVEASHAAGADRHVSKPVSAANLTAVLEEFCAGATEKARAA